ncbi:c-type cytochrome biogenesis protein CcmI [Paraperlucidibaca sp.]|jgi:cytochrome c-type biogenesis protein CcmH|uniref:c-type cytochrome biogenesis protein CcmI n=2 Tax=Paraperlucidibaca sp. TaxID=2708021 RepID=UPI0030F3BDEF|tara:strand:- start:10602 stop:11888 length:1287 start_codon:yes stop_codon:yes gene_type:complete
MMSLGADQMTLVPMVLAAILLALATAFCLLWPLRGGMAVTGRSAQALSKQIYHERLAELNADHMASRITAETYAALKLELDRGLLADNQQVADQSSRPLKVGGLALALLLIVPVASVALWLGVFLSPGLAKDTHNAERLAPTIDKLLAGQDMAEQSPDASLPDFMRALQRRVQADPHNGEGWLTLGLGFMQAREFGPAKEALARAVELSPSDIQVAMTYVQASIMSQQGAMDSLAANLLNGILQREPDHQGALLMLGMGSLRAGDNATALAVLTKLRALRAAMPAAEADSAADQRIAGLIAEAGSAGEVTAAADTLYRIEVTLAPEVARAIPADATLFIFAREPAGMPMPIAAVGQPVAQFPMSIALNDRHSLNSARLLSSFADVVISARISTSGDATGPGWQAVAVPVQKASDQIVRLRISEKVEAR